MYYVTSSVSTYETA